MSDCSTMAWDVPMSNRYTHKFGDAQWREPKQAEQPSAAKLRKKLGEPPWTLEVPDFGQVPEDMADMVGTLVWKGRRYRRVQPHEEQVEVKEVDG